MDGSRLRQLLIIVAALSVGASLWLLPRAAGFITPAPPTPIELQAVPTPAETRGARGDPPGARVAEPAPGVDDDDRGSSAAAVGDTDDDDDGGGAADTDRVGNTNDDDDRDDDAGGADSIDDDDAGDDD